MKETTKKIFRSVYTPLELQHFTKATQESFCGYIGKDNHSEIDKLLTKQAFRAALHDMLNELSQKRYGDEEDLEKILKDFETIKCCYDPPIESFYDDHSSQLIKFFEDYTVLVSPVTDQCPPYFHRNYYSYIYNNLHYLYSVMYNEGPGSANKLEKFGLYSEVEGDNLTVLYTEKFKHGLFTPDYFKPKRK